MNTRDQNRLDELVRSARAGTLSRVEFLKRAAAAGLAVSVPALLAACGGSSGGGGEAASTAAEATTSAAAATGAESAAPGQSGGAMRLGLPFGPASSYDPQLPSGGLNGRFLNWNVFDTLFWFDNDGNLVPALAEEATPNADATEWTITLKSGVTFHDGSPFTADDVVYSLKRILDPATKADGMGQISMIDPSGLRKVDDLTVQIPLKYPFSILPSQLTYFTEIVKNGETAFTPPVGTGAFMFESGDASTLRLIKNPNYWKSGLPLLDSVEMTNVQDSTARLNALRTGEVDAIYPSDSTQTAVVQADPNLQVFVNKSGAFLPMYMNVSKAPFTDNRVREALKFAADREEMNKVAYGGEGALGNDMFGMFNPSYPTDLEQRPYDPERAKALWEEAGMAGQAIEFWTSDNYTGQRTHALVYAQQAKAAGIDVQVKQVPPDQWSTKVYGVKPFANDYWYFNPILTLMSQTFVPDASYFAVASWQTPETTQLYTQAAAETDVNKRNALENQMLEIFRNDGPYIVWAYEASPDFYSAKIGGQANCVVRSMNGLKLEGFFVKS